ncbi:MAG: long-chain fatty acid--CoA ligase [Longimicrobiales bacterium]
MPVAATTIASASAGSAPNYAATPADLPEGTLVQLFLDAIDEYGASPAQMHDDNGTWRSITHDDMYQRVRQITAALTQLGVTRDDNVGLLSENRPEWAQIDYAVMCAGAHTVPLYPTLPANQLGFIVQHAGTNIVFASTAEQLAKLMEVRNTVPSLTHIIVCDDVPAGPGAQTLRQLLESVASVPSDAAFREEARRAQPSDVATIIYTSGTTGVPKGVMLTHNNLYSNAQAGLRTAVDVGTTDIALSFLPLSHVFQRTVDYAMFRGGATLAYVAAMDRVLPAMAAVKPTVAVAVPRVYEKIYTAVLSGTGPKQKLVLWARRVAMAWAEARLTATSPSSWLKAQHAVADRLVFSKLRSKLGGRIRFFVSGGAPLAPDIARFFYGAGVTILEGYGLTETSPVTNVNTPQSLRIGTVGRPVPGTELRLAEDGEVLVRGPQVMKGYYKNEQGTRDAIDPEGWFHTGDIGSLDADGFLRITDRKKDLLVTAGGKNIAPQPIQNAAKGSRFISEALLIGDRKPYALLMAVPNFENLKIWAKTAGLDSGDMDKLVKEPAVRAKYEEEVAARTASFARYEQPKKVLVLPREFSIDAGEITPKLSIRRKVVEDHYREQIEELYAEPAHPDHHD